MDAYAVIETGGKQYMVRAGDVLDIERMDGEKGQAVALASVLAVSDGSALQVGAPKVGGAAVQAEIVTQHRGDKVISFKKKRRKGYTRKVGHRQSLTKIKILAIKAG